MKSKKSLYILIPLVFIIWGLIIYRAVDMTGIPIKQVSDISIAVFSNDTAIHKSLQKLKMKYEDPFLKTIKRTEIEQTENGNIFFINPEPELVKLIWPEIQYKGIIENNNNNTAIIEFESRIFIITKNEEFQNLTIEYIYRDSIVMKQSDKMKTYYK